MGFFVVSAREKEGDHGLRYAGERCKSCRDNEGNGVGFRRIHINTKSYTKMKVGNKFQLPFIIIPKIGWHEISFEKNRGLLTFNIQRKLEYEKNVTLKNPI